MRNKGKVKWFNKEKGYGFIVKEDGNDIFVHYKDLNMEGFKLLKDGQEVEFDIGIADYNKTKATNVTVIGE